MAGSSRGAQWEDFYELMSLDIPHGSTASDVPLSAINSRYKRLALKWHPDKSRHRTREFAALQRAMDVLRDPRARAAYDAEHEAKSKREREERRRDEEIRRAKKSLDERERAAADALRENPKRRRREEPARADEPENERLRVAALSAIRHRSLHDGDKALLKNQSVVRVPVKVFTLEQHLDRERAILGRALGQAR